MIFNIRLSISFLVFFIFSHSVYCQTNVTIKGVTIDSLKNEVVPNASVQIVGTKKGTSTNSRGEFVFYGIKPGTYSIAISCIGYETDTILNITVNENIYDLGKIHLNQALQSFSGGGKAVARKTNSVKAGIQEIKKAEVVANNISSEQIARSQDSDAAKAAARVPGVTLLENRFIMLRGLSQRYNSVQINGINAPSTEVDRRAFSFDLIPSSMLDKIMIYKSPASDLSGDFAGGVIKISTKSNVERDFLTVGFGLGYRLGTTFSKAQHNSVGSKTDLLGFDNGNRDLPNGFPASIAGYNNSQSILYGQMLKNNFELSEIRTPLDFGWSLSQGKNFKINKMKLFTTNSFGYSTNYINAPTRRYRYQYDQLEYVKQMFDYRDDNFSVESKISILSNWILKINKNHTLAFKNIFNQIGENETTIRNGANPTERPQDEFKNYGFHYTSRSIYFSQLEGVLILNDKNDKLNYGLGFSNINRNEPDYRRFRTSRIIGSNEDFSLIDPPSASLFDAARFYSKLKENTISATVNYEKHFHNKVDTLKDIILRAGAYVENKDRTFDARWISYGYIGNPLMKNDILKQPIEQLFSLPNINSTAGFKPNEGTNPNDKYDANNQLIAGYINATIPLDFVSFNIGARVEQFNQSLNSATQNGPVNVLQPNLNILPSINSTLYFTEKKLLRLGYGRTVNRPEFRELAPFVYYDFMYDVNIVGNPDLKSATIDNVDLRYEFYPSSSETISLGAFYKNFINPIENYVQPIGLSQQFYLQNATGADNYGLELEVRKSLENETQNLFLKNLSINFNASYIISKVDLGDDSTLSQDRERALQGQSPYIINTGIMYSDDKKKFNVNIAYNIFGERIAYVGNAIFPTVYEMPRHALDLTVSKDITKRLSLKFGISDLLNYKSQLWQDTDNDGKINMKKEFTDHQLMEFRRGQMFNFNVYYKLK
jgi:YD repeat-containing protein